MVDRDERSGEMTILPLGYTTRTGSTLQVRKSKRSQKPVDLREGGGTIFGEHRCDHVNHNAELGLIRSSAVDEYVLGIERNLGVLRVDNWWHRKYPVLGIVDNRVYRRVFYDMQVTCKVLLFLEDMSVVVIQSMPRSA